MRQPEGDGVFVGQDDDARRQTGRNAGGAVLDIAADQSLDGGQQFAGVGRDQVFLARCGVQGNDEGTQFRLWIHGVRPSESSAALREERS